MKKLLAILCMLPSLAFGAVYNDLAIARIQQDGFNTYLDFVTTYKQGELQFIMFDGAGLVSTVRKVGPSITCGAEFCDVASGGTVNWSSIMGKPSFANVAFTGAYADITGKPITLAGYGITDGTSANQLATALVPYATSASLSGYATSSQLTTGLASKQATVTLTTTGSGAATFNAGTGAFNIPTPTPSAPFNYGAPTAKTIAASTAYQAADTTKAAVVTISPACTNTTTVLAASACTMQVRQSSAAGLTCSNGTVASTWSSTIALGLVITQGNSFPVDVKIPAGGYFIVCSQSGTFTLSAVEQSAG